ncbi:hypothetical protein BpHYR1_015460 [Brachionus plicatilis]|uniref:Uncharacterized protein n=1 Tax=Brachionus plicatilis TaxID=10195 RepID=A0A3M7PTH1_BRAPC|nr:hypothetical protein BpHYR1_015460 [Brachionus plicatilis]
MRMDFLDSAHKEESKNMLKRKKYGGGPWQCGKYQVYLESARDIEPEKYTIGGSGVTGSLQRVGEEVGCGGDSGRWEHGTGLVLFFDRPTEMLYPKRSFIGGVKNGPKGVILKVRNEKVDTDLECARRDESKNV